MPISRGVCLVLFMVNAVANASHAQTSWRAAVARPANNEPADNLDEDGPSDDPLLDRLRARVRQSPEHADSWRLLAKRHAKLGEFERSIELLLHALRLQPDLVAAHADIASSLTRVERYQEADRHREIVMTIGGQTHYADVVRRLNIPRFDESSPTQSPWDTESSSGNQLDPIRSDQNVVAGGLFNDPPTSFENEMIDGDVLLADGTWPLRLNEDFANPFSTVSYTIQAFDGSEEATEQFEVAEPLRDSGAARLFAWMETGILFNSNLSLTPISRALRPSDTSAWQAFVNPFGEYAVIDHGTFQTGPLGGGYASWNEGRGSDLRLFSFDAGWFGQRHVRQASRIRIDRGEYRWTSDRQGGERFAMRHHLQWSSIWLDEFGNQDLLYLSYSHSDFVDDGSDPISDSLDGPQWSVGGARSFVTDHRTLTRWRFGFEGTLADTDGLDSRFWGLGGYLGCVFRVGQHWQIEPETGIGFRGYDDFTGEVDRDEWLPRAEIRARRWVTTASEVIWNLNYDQFRSDNDEFDAERWIGGVAWRWRY